MCLKCIQNVASIFLVFVIFAKKHPYPVSRVSNIGQGVVPRRLVFVNVVGFVVVDHL